jgi:hypothetical protein
MKPAFTLILSIIALSIFAQTPLNDDCSGIIDVGAIPFCSAPAQYTNIGATPSIIDITGNNVPSCFNNGANRDVWFQFELPADGSIVEVLISIYGNVNGNGTLGSPELSIYRGDCSFGSLSELNCAVAPAGVNEVHLPALNLTPGIAYFLRINDYSNAGTFKLCIEKYIPDINIGTQPILQSCTGTLWDSGGPNADYANQENLKLTICPKDPHQCIRLNVENYTLEQGIDYLIFYEGSDLNALQLTQLTGSGSNFQIQIPSNCATIQFTSDGTITDSGFKITWECSDSACITPSATTCTNPSVIASLPYTANNLSNCFSGNSISNGPCGQQSYLSGNDYIRVVAA